MKIRSIIVSVFFLSLFIIPQLASAQIADLVVGLKGGNSVVSYRDSNGVNQRNWQGAAVSLTLIFTNTVGTDVYINKTPSSALSTSVSSGPNSSVVATNVTATGNTVGDTASSYLIPIGTSREFTYNFTIANTEGTGADKIVKIVGIYYGNDKNDTKKYLLGTTLSFSALGALGGSGVPAPTPTTGDVVSCPQGYECVPISSMCPEGYTCEATPQPAGCPKGYICKINITPTPATPIGECYMTNISSYMRVGSTGKEVMLLQEFLIKSGYLTLPSDTAMGYFGELTRIAVVEYQSNVGLPPTGFVGPLTLGKINATCNGPILGDAPVSNIPQTPGTLVTVSNTQASSFLVDNGTRKANQAIIGFSFTLNNLGPVDVYISKSPYTALATSSTIGTAASSTLTQSLTTTSPTNSQDSSTAYLIPSGTSRSFVYTGLLDNTNGLGSNHSTYIKKIYFSDSQTNLQKFSTSAGLEKLATPVVNIGDGSYIPPASTQPSITSISPQSAQVGSSLIVYFTNGGNAGSVIIKTIDGSKTWFVPYTTGTVYNGFVYYDGSKVTLTIPATIGRGQLPENTGYEAPVPVTSGTYNLFVYSVGLINSTGAVTQTGGTTSAFPITINTSTPSVQPSITNVTVSFGKNSDYDLVKGKTYVINWNEAQTKDIIYVYLDRLVGSEWQKQFTIGTVKPVGNGQNSVVWDVPADLKTFDSKYKIYVETIGSGGGVPVGFIANTQSSSIVVSDPGEFWRIGNTYTINFSVNEKLTTSYKIYLEKYHEPQSGKTGVNSSMLIGQVDSTSFENKASFKYTVPSSFNSYPGQGSTFKIKVCDNTCITSASSRQFSINSGNQTSQASVTVLSPNGGETLMVGKSYPIRWATSNLPLETKVVFQLEYRTNAGNTYEDGFDVNPIPNTGVFNWTIPTKYANMQPNFFKLRAVLVGPNVAGTNPPQDYSDSYFTIASPVTQPVIPAGTALISNTSAVLLAPTIVNNEVLAYGAQYSFTITASGGSIYISKGAGFFQQMLSSQNLRLDWGSTIASGMTVADGRDYFMIPEGVSRNFVVSYTINTTGARGLTYAQVTQLVYGTSPTSLYTRIIKDGLTNLRVNPDFISSSVNPPATTVTPPTQPFVDINVNGSNDSVTVVSGSPVRVYWRFQGMKTCIPTWRTSPLTTQAPNVNVAGDDSAGPFTNTQSTRSYVTVALVCTTESGARMTDQVQVFVEPATTVSTPPAPTPTAPAPVAQPSSVSSALSLSYAGTGDATGPWNWSPDGTPDHYFKARLTSSSKTIKSIDFNHNAGGEYWSTSNSGAYPISVYQNDSPVITSYGQTLSVSGTIDFKLYMQRVSSFSGGTLTITFTDGTSVSATVAANSVSSLPSRNLNASLYDSLRSYFQSVGW